MSRDEPGDGVTQGVTRGLNTAASIQFLLYNNERYVSGKRSKNIYLFYCDSYYAWMCLLKMSHN